MRNLFGMLKTHWRCGTYFHKLRTINKDINSLKRKLASLEKQKVKLLEIQKDATA
jgi:hypothetical protein